MPIPGTLMREIASPGIDPDQHARGERGRTGPMHRRMKLPAYIARR